MSDEAFIRREGRRQWRAANKFQEVRQMFEKRATFVAGCVILLTTTHMPAAAQDSRSTLATIVKAVQRADYAGDRRALKQLHEQLAEFLNDRATASRVLYWRGFALWRRALNGFNNSADSREIEADLTQAVVDLRESVARDPGFADAEGGEASCLANLAFLKRNDSARSRQLLLNSVALLNKALAVAPENPRLLWVEGANQWYGRPERGGGQQAALETYEKGLRFARQQKLRVNSPLDPAWGEPELLMNLAFSNLNRSAPDVAAAERYARQALHLVPYWHYVRDVLMTQIQERKPK